MRRDLREARRQGALGLSTGLIYARAFASTTEEVMTLAEQLTDAGGLYTTHLRSAFALILDAMDEVFRIGRHGLVPVFISYHKCAGAQMPFMTMSKQIFYYTGGSSLVKNLVAILIFIAAIGWLDAHILGGGLYLAWARGIDINT